jgi:hypothetical protein
MTPAGLHMQAGPRQRVQVRVAVEFVAGDRQLSGNWSSSSAMWMSGLERPCCCGSSPSTNWAASLVAMQPAMPTRRCTAPLRRSTSPLQ